MKWNTARDAALERMSPAARQPMIEAARSALTLRVSSPVESRGAQNRDEAH